MPVETRSERQFRERKNDSFKKIGSLVYSVQRNHCVHCDEEFVTLMNLYDAVTETGAYRLLVETYACAELYVIAKCAEYLGAVNIYNSITVTGGHLFAVLDVARYDTQWREICAELDMTFIHSKKH